MGKLSVNVVDGALVGVVADAVAAFVFKGGEAEPASRGVAEGVEARRVLDLGDFRGKAREVALLYAEGLGARRLLLGGLGERGKVDVHVVRDLGARLARRAREAGAKRLALAVPRVEGLEARVVAEALVEGALLGTYRFTRYKSRKGEGEEDAPRELVEVLLVPGDSADRAAVEEGARFAASLAESVNFARDLATLSGDDAHPARFGERAHELASETGLGVEVFDKARIEELGMGGVLAVNRGSVHEPRFVVLEHKPEGVTGKPFVVVGKGITFDTGGISIKPAKDMDQMRFDKSGACAVLGLMRACALLRLPVHVVGVTAWTENMPSGSAYKPGDVIRMLNGKTVEVTNTDAEGRMILADCLTYASRFDPAAVVELSTLTGGVIVALGSQAVGAMGNDAALLGKLRESGERTRERLWELPLWEEYDELLKSKVADLVNSGARSATAIQGGVFLKHFIGDYPWVHLDIAGTAWNQGKPGFIPDVNPGEATGVGVRLLVDVLRRWDGTGA